MRIKIEKHNYRDFNLKLIRKFVFKPTIFVSNGEQFIVWLETVYVLHRWYRNKWETDKYSYVLDLPDKKLKEINNMLASSNRGDVELAMGMLKIYYPKS